MIRIIKPSTYDTVWVKGPDNTSWVIDKTRIKIGAWDENGVLIKYYTTMELGSSLPKV